MDVNSTQAALRQSGESLVGGGRPEQSGQALQKEDFLRLLMTQMANQDPLDPMDSKGMMEQMAQMGALEQLTNIHGQLETLNNVQGEISRAIAFSYLDKDVTVKGGTARVGDGNVAVVNYSLIRDAAVQVHINDESNSPVRTLDLGYQGPGEHIIHWDGKDADGDPVSNGSYTYRVVAESEDGSRVPVDLFSTGKVERVRFNNERPMIHMNGQVYDARDVMGVSNESERRYGGREPMGLRTEMTPMPPMTERRR